MNFAALKSTHQEDLAIKENPHDVCSNLRAFY